MKKTFTFVVLVLIIATLLAACGSNSDTDGIAVGNSAPDFSLTNSEGNIVSLSDYQGQPVLLFFHMAGG